MIFNRLGIDMREDCWLTNAMICHPPGNEIKNQKMVDYCRPNLLNTIEKLKPEVIILLGGVAVRSLCNWAWKPEPVKISRWVGWRVPCQRLNSWVCPTWHPAYLLRQEDQMLDAYFVEHLKAAFALRGRPFKVVPDYASQVKRVFDVSEAASFIDNIDSGVVAFDFECNMLKPESPKARIYSCSVCYDGDTIAFPFHGKVIKSLKRMLANKNVRKIASNMKYEDRWVRSVLGVETKGWLWDTMLGAHILDCRRGVTGLKFVSFVMLGQPGYDTHIEKFLHAKVDSGYEINRIHEIPLDQLLTYNGLDSLLEYLVAGKQRQGLGLRDLSSYAEAH